MAAIKTSRPQFYKTTKQNKAKSEKEGRPIFDEIEMVRVFIPGDRLFTPVFPVADEHRQRWPEEYAAFKRGETRAASGTPLEHWPILTTGRIAEFKALNILSVEELAGVSDSKLGSLGPNARSERDQARAFIDLAMNGAAASAQAAENAALKAQMAGLQEQMAGLLNKPAAKAATKAA
jgi:hypothetical protein